MANDARIGWLVVQKFVDFNSGIEGKFREIAAVRRNGQIRHPEPHPPGFRRIAAKVYLTHKIPRARNGFRQQAGRQRLKISTGFFNLWRCVPQNWRP
jgi:hypothetical protein